MTDAIAGSAAPCSIDCPFASRKLLGYRVHFWRRWPFLTANRESESQLISFARTELARIGSGEADEMQDAMNEHILRMVRTFADEGHSGFSAGYAVSVLQKLLRFQPLTPLTGEDDEWNEVGLAYGGEEPCYQNRRCSHVFKDASGAYDINGRVFVEPDGCSYTNGKSRVPVTFPYVPTTKYVKVKAPAA